jgi:hypothetical protein
MGFTCPDRMFSGRWDDSLSMQWLVGTSITEVGVERLQQELPKCKIVAERSAEW